MKSWKVTISSLIVLIICMGQVNAKPGKGGGKPGGEDPPAVTSCAGFSSAFPAFVFNQVKLGRKGTISGYDIFLSNKDGDCTVKLASVSDNSDKIDLKLKVNGSSGIVVWRQTSDENGSKRDYSNRHDVIRSINFQVNSKEVTSVSSVQTLANSGTRDIEYLAIDLSSDANTLLVVSAQPNTSGSYFGTVNEMDISSCSSNCSMSSVYTETPDAILFDVKYNDSDNRIYLLGYHRHFSGNGALAGMGYISLIENQGGFWSAPRFVTLENNGFYGSDHSYPYPFKHLDVATVDLGSGPVEAITYTFYNPSSSQFDVHVMDVGSCSVSGSGDCLIMGEASIEATVADATTASLTSNSMRFASGSSSSIFEYSFSSQNLRPIGSGYETDDVN